MDTTLSSTTRNVIRFIETSAEYCIFAAFIKNSGVGGVPAKLNTLNTKKVLNLTDLEN